MIFCLKIGINRFGLNLFREARVCGLVGDRMYPCVLTLTVGMRLIVMKGIDIVAADAAGIFEGM